ncbi:MAG: hypothetical protein GY940_01790 [bacterium]|nr:hypothetical protein [bacterium]
MTDAINKNPGTVYNDNIHRLNDNLKQLNKKHVTFGIVKLTWTILGLLGLFRVFPFSMEMAMGFFGLCLLLFIITAIFHETVIRKVAHLKTLKTINQNELKFLAHRFPDGLDTGEDSRNGDHHYSSDLDIYGEHGIFHYINRGVTAIGKRCLAGWLNGPAEPGEIKKRQEGVEELVQKIDLRQSAAAHGLRIDGSYQKLDGLYRFLEEPFSLLGKKWLMVFLYIWPLLTLASAVMIFFKLPLMVFFGMALVQVGVNRKFSHSVSRLYKLTSKSHKILTAYSRIIKEIEKEDFTSEKLNRLKERLSVDMETEKTGKQKASVCIRRLSTLLEWFDMRNGSVHPIFNNTVFWDLHCMYRIEKWRKGIAHRVEEWFNVVGEFEALSSLAAVGFNNPGWVVPEICEGAFRLEARGVGHPLIPAEERVCSDVDLDAAGDASMGSMIVVTGPNMAGKSTFLRAIGVSLALAFAGGPVCAEKFRVSWVSLFTSMQTSDSLDKHLSLFYAELQRLKMILDGITNGEPVFFLIDEMLKGTNELDRRKGAIALLKQLIKYKANGIVATHDMELTKLTRSNYHFDGYVEGDKLLFDYLLKKGTCESFNALVLMKKIGIDV